VNLGATTSGGGSQHLARAVGNSRAMELMLTGRMWSVLCQVWAALNEPRHGHERGGSLGHAYAVGKSRAMELVLTVRMWTTQVAAAWCVVRMTRASKVLMVMTSSIYHSGCESNHSLL
jgi:enoyl-CoA hydratase/carnithine racemase